MFKPIKEGYHDPRKDKRQIILDVSRFRNNFNNRIRNRNNNRNMRNRNNNRLAGRRINMNQEKICKIDRYLPPGKRVMNIKPPVCVKWKRIWNNPVEQPNCPCPSCPPSPAIEVPLEIPYAVPAPVEVPIQTMETIPEPSENMPNEIDEQDNEVDSPKKPKLNSGGCTGKCDCTGMSSFKSIIGCMDSYDNCKKADKCWFVEMGGGFKCEPHTCYCNDSANNNTPCEKDNEGNDIVVAVPCGLELKSVSSKTKSNCEKAWDDVCKKQCEDKNLECPGFLNGDSCITPGSNQNTNNENGNQQNGNQQDNNNDTNENDDNPNENNNNTSDNDGNESFNDYSWFYKHKFL